MGLEKVIHRMSTDSSFAKRMGADPETTLKEAKFNLSLEEFKALESVMEILGGSRLSSLSTDQLAQWYSTQLAQWY